VCNVHVTPARLLDDLFHRNRVAKMVSTYVSLDHGDGDSQASSPNMTRMGVQFIYIGG
jgi:hypothetical protein